MNPTAGPSVGPIRVQRGVQAAMTAQLAMRQFGLMLAAATALLGMTFFFNFYHTITFRYLWEPQLSLKYIHLPALLVVVYGYVLLNGILFALGPSERSFRLFFGGMILALILVNYDHSVIDWFVTVFGQVAIVLPHPVSVFKIAIAGLFFLAVISMHYNVLSDDFARRMLQRGVPTEEVAQIRPGMFKVLVPTVLAAAAIATGLGLVGEFSAFVFQQNGLFLPKLELVLLAALVAPAAFLLRGILRDMARRGVAPPRDGTNR